VTAAHCHVWTFRSSNMLRERQKSAVAAARSVPQRLTVNLLFHGRYQGER
jgi:hypothetical protein